MIISNIFVESIELSATDILVDICAHVLDVNQAGGSS